VRVEISDVSAVDQCKSSGSSRPIISTMSWSTLFQISLFTGHWSLCADVFLALVPHLVQVEVVLVPFVCSLGSA
jgi:hypothetical protein